MPPHGLAHQNISHNRHVRHNISLGASRHAPRRSGQSSEGVASADGAAIGVALAALFLLLCALVMAIKKLPVASKLRSVAAQFVLAAALCILQTSQPLLMQLAKLRNGGLTPFHTPSMVFYTEALKTVVALIVYMIQLPGLEYTGLENLSALSVLTYALPAVLYAIQNNLNYVALKYIDAPTYQLFGCSKIVFAGVFFRIVLGRRLTCRKWVALGLLAIGMAISSLRPSESSQNSSNDTSGDSAGSTIGGFYFGVGLVQCTSALSGLSAIVNEWLIKMQDPKAPLMLKNLLLYLIGLLVCIGSWQPRAPVGDIPIFLALICVQACAGLCVSFVLKYCDSLVKGFSASVAVLCATIISALLFGFEMATSFMAGTFIVFAAFYMYFVEPTGM